MISSEQKNIPTEVEHVIEQFLVDQKVHFATITKSNAQYKATIEKRTGQKVLSNINYLIGVALRQGTNILTITQNGYECMLETFLQRSLIEAYTGTILFLVPDTTTCKALQETFQEHLSTDHMVPITALETLPEKHILLADVVVSSGPVIQSCLMSPEKASTLASWLATVKLVVIPNMQYLSLAKRTLTLSLLQLLRPQQVFLTTSHEHAIQDLEQFMTKLTCKKTQILRFQKDQADKHYFLITKDFTFAKRTALLKQLLNQPQLNFIFTQTKAASQKVYYELKKLIQDETSKGMVVINLDACTPKKLQETIIPYITKQPAICITSQPVEDVRTELTTITLFFIGLPKRTSEFFRYEQSITSSAAKATKNIIVLGGNEYDRLLVTNKALFQTYVTSGSYQQDYLPDATLATLVKAAVHIKKHFPLSPGQQHMLLTLQVARKDITSGIWDLTPLGKLLVREYLLFRKKKYTVYFLHTKDRQPKNKMIDREDLDVLYYPGTIHYEDQTLQEVQTFEEDKKGHKKPVFVSLEGNKRLQKLYKKHNYRTFVEPEIQYNPDTLLTSGVALLNSRPHYLYKSYVDRQNHPFRLVSKRKQLTGATTTIQFGQLVKLAFYEEPINMAMVLHAFIHALRLLYDIDYRTFSYTFNDKETTSGVKVHEALLIDRTLSDVLRTLDIEKTLETARIVLSNYLKLNKIASEEEPDREFTALVIPLPHKRYHPTKNEQFSYARIQDCFNHIEQALHIFQASMDIPFRDTEEITIHKVISEDIDELKKPEKSIQDRSQIVSTTIIQKEQLKKDVTRTQSNFIQELKTSDWNSIKKKLQKDLPF